jgi:hypothetical protein
MIIPVIDYNIEKRSSQKDEHIPNLFLKRVRKIKRQLNHVSRGTAG